MNHRLIALAAIICIILLLLFGIGYALLKPVVDREVATVTAIARITEDASMRLTQTAAVYGTSTAVAATQTKAAEPTATPTDTPTQTPTYTHTPTATPTPVPTTTPTSIPPRITCSAFITNSNGMVFAVPGGSLVDSADTLNADTLIEVVGRIRDKGWYQVSYNERFGWVRSDMITFEDPTCEPTTYTVAYLLGLDLSGTKVLIDDTFASNDYDWQVNGGPINSFLTEYGESYLKINSPSESILRSGRQSIHQSGPFTLEIVYDRSNYATAGYMGVNFRRNADTYYQIRVLGNCNIEIYESNSQVFSRPAFTTINTCADDIPDYLKLSLDDSYLLQITFNGSDPFTIQLNNPSETYTSGEIELVVSQTIVDLYYLVIVEP